MSTINDDIQYKVPADGATYQLKMPLQGEILSTLIITIEGLPAVVFSSVTTYPKGVTVDVVVPIGTALGTYNILIQEPGDAYTSFNAGTFKVGAPFDVKGNDDICDFEIGTDVIRDESGVNTAVCPNLSDTINLLAPGALNVFGRDYQEDDSEPESTTTSQTYQNKLTLNATGLTIGGRYKVEFYCEISSSTTNRSVKARVQIDGVLVAETDIENKDNDNYYPFGGNSKFTAVAASSTITIDWVKVGSNAQLARIRRARLEIYRVS